MHLLTDSQSNDFIKTGLDSCKITCTDVPPTGNATGERHNIIPMRKGKTNITNHAVQVCCRSALPSLFSILSLSLPLSFLLLFSVSFSLSLSDLFKFHNMCQSQSKRPLKLLFPTSSLGFLCCLVISAVVIRYAHCLRT